MLKLWVALAGFLLYMEAVYHLSCFGLTPMSPAFTLCLIASLGGLQSLVIGSISKNKRKKLIFWLFLATEYVLVAAQLVYMNIFNQPLLWEAIFHGASDALSNYWRETLMGIWKTTTFLLLLAIPLLLSGVLFRINNKNAKALRGWELPVFNGIDKLRSILITGVGIIMAVTVIFIGKFTEADYYEYYTEFFTPLSVAETMGVFALSQRDITISISGIFKNIQKPTSGNAMISNTVIESSTDTEGSTAAENRIAIEGNAVSADRVGNNMINEKDVNELLYEEDVHELLHEETINNKEAWNTLNILPIDFSKLDETHSTEEKWLAEYIQGLMPTARNEYTGVFKDYNLIFLTAEGFSTYAIREDLTPTLYRLANSGFVFKNFFAPLWQTSTSDGEYINLTGLIPDGQFSMRKSSVNHMAFSLPRYFEKEGVESYAYHNNSLSYYERHRTHPNLGYDFKAASLGNLTEEEWGHKIFPMENPLKWPASDLEMMMGTMTEYLALDRFHVYYLTVSGHMNYNFRDNAMSGKNKEAVEHLNLSINAKAYLACQIELDKALKYLLEELEAAGKLENTVICMATDHYPYAMTLNEYEELAGRSLSKNLDIFRNSLILWNAGMEENPVIVEKVCGTMDIIPTLLNLFGFEYDSRLYAGRDIFSEEEGMVIFNDRSFVTDSVFYDRKVKTPVWAVDLEEDTEASGEEAVYRIVKGKRSEAAAEEERKLYVDEKKQEVKERYDFSAYILRNDFYRVIWNILGL